MLFQLTRDEPTAMDGVHESETVLGGARLALPGPDSTLPAWARNVARWTVASEGSSAGAVAVGRGTRRTETEPVADQFVEFDLLGVDVEQPQFRARSIGRLGGPGDAEDQFRRGIAGQRGPN